MTESVEVPDKRDAPDIDEYLVLTHPENELISLYGEKIGEVLRTKGGSLRTVDAFGWAK